MRHSLLKILALVALVAPGQVALAGGPFSAPKDGPPSFRRDRIPLEIVDIRRLSDALARMGATIKDDQAEDRRLAAQCIALSLALDPSNRDARRLLKAWEDGRFRPQSDSDELNKALRFSAGLIAWLEDDVAGRDAGLLASCLRDVISRVGSSKDEYRELGEAQLIADWNDFVPALSAYEKGSEVNIPVPDPDPNPLHNPDNREFALAFDRAEITIPMWYRNINPQSGQSWVLKPGRMFVRAQYDKSRKREPFRMQVGGDRYADKMGEFTKSIINTLNQSLGGLPGGLRVEIGSEALSEALESQQPQSISAAAVVLAGCVIRGVPPAADTIVIGRVDNEGNYLPSSDMWEKLKAFDKGKGQRLVVPTKSRQYFEAMLTMGRIKYFLDYEVVTASNVKELLDLAASRPESAMSEASRQFAEIQKVAPEESNIRSFVANTHVRKRLEEVVKSSDRHLSAELLLMQSYSSVKFDISREVLCAELKYIIKPFEQIKEITLEAAEERSYRRLPIGRMAKDAREQAAALDRYVGREDRPLYQAIDQFFAEMREYDKALKTKGPADYVNGVLVKSSAAAEQAYLNYARMLDRAMNP